MSSLYKLDVLYILRSALLKKHYASNMSYEEKSVYDAVLLDIYGTLDTKIDDSYAFNTYFEDYFNDWYLNKGTLSDEELSKVEELLIFRGLLNFIGKTVSLKELYDFTFGEYFKDRYNLFIESDRNAFLERLNGCLGEARVAKVDDSSFIPRESTLSRDEMDWIRLIPSEHEKISLCDEIDVRVSTNYNPLLFITGLEPCEVKKFDVEDGKRFTFISISDLHLGGCLVDSHGKLVSRAATTLKERLRYFVAFKEQIIEDLRKNNILVDGIVFVGDNLNAVSASYDPMYDKVKLADNLVDSREAIFKIIKDFNGLNGCCLQFGNEMGFIGFISGNHDITMGGDLFFEAMKEFGEDITFLGDGAGRIKINDEYILFSHPNSYDWGLPVSVDFFKMRRNFEHDIFHFDEYFTLCRRKYEFLDELNLLHMLGNTPKDRIMKIASLVNDDLKKNNPTLYKFYEPFITKGNGSGNVVRPSCFEESMRIIVDDRNPSITYLAKKHNVEHGFAIGKFIEYCDNNKNIREMLEERSICFTGDHLAPTLSIIGHFHARLNNGKKVCYAKEDSNGSDGLVPVVVKENSSHHREDGSTFSATVCCLDIKDGVIDRIELEPAVYVVNKTGRQYQAVREFGTTSSVYVRKKTL